MSKHNYLECTYTHVRSTEESKESAKSDLESLLEANGGSNRNAQPSSEAPICRICLRGDSSEVLVSPCDCRGSINNIHQGCLEQWLEVTNTDRCDLCLYKFQLVKTQKSCLDYFNDPKTLVNRKKLMIYFCGLMLSTPMVVLFVVGSMQHAFYLSAYTDRVWDAAALSALSTAVCIGQAALIYLTAKFFYDSIVEYKSHNYNVTLTYKNLNSSGNSEPAGGNENVNIGFVSSSSSSSSLPPSSSSSSSSGEHLPLIRKDNNANTNNYSTAVSSVVC